MTNFSQGNGGNNGGKWGLFGLSAGGGWRGALLPPVQWLVLVVCFGCLCVFVCLAFRASTEQGLPARRPCTRARSVPWLNHCTLPRVPSLRLRANRAAADTLPA
jgi:hypothetical protein